MVFEAPISLSGVLAPLARAGCRKIPRSLRKREFFGNLELKLNAVPLRQQFDAIVAEGDRHGQWLALRRAASLLDRLDIAHPGAEAGPAVWRAFLAHIIDAAEDGNVVDGKAGRRDIVTGQHVKGDIEVISGLAAKEIIVIGGIQKIRDGAAVKLANPPQAAAKPGMS